MKMNYAMRNILEKMRFYYPIISSLKAIADDGFVQKEGCYILNALSSGFTNVKRESFPDCTGYECFVNSVHVEDHDDKEPLMQAILFVKQVFSVWNTSTQNLTLIAIVSADEFSVVAKFHVSRPTEQWLSDNIEGYGDPIMSVNSTEDIAFV